MTLPYGRNEFTLRKSGGLKLELVTKKCPNCGASVDFDCDLETAQCCYCDSMVFVKQTPVESDTFTPCTQTVPIKKKGMSCLLKTVLFIFALIGLFFLVFIAFVIVEVINDMSDTGYSVTIIDSNTRAPDADQTYVYNPGETFIFDGFEITIFDSIIWHESAEDTIKVPITLTNLSEETRAFNWYRMTTYGAAGLTVRSSFNFDEDNIQHRLRDMRGGATSSDMFIYIPYDGDGDYFISFDTHDEATREVKIHISR